MSIFLEKKGVKINKKVLVSCFFAGCLEMYDFTVFGLLTPILHKNYLSFVEERDAIIIAYALFAVGFIFRPLGSLIFGYIGDVYGRKTALVASVSFMGFASLAMFLLPTYQAIGIISCYIIAAVRITQGVSVGGEFTGAIIYAVECLDRKKAGFVGSFIVGGCLSGILLATVVSGLVKNNEMFENGWRFAFLLGFLLSIIGFFIRKKLSETPEFEVIRYKRSKLPLIAGLKKFKLESLTVIMIGATTGINIYYVIVYLPNYLSNVFKYNFSYLPVVTTLMLAVFSPIFGWYSDRTNRGMLITIGAILTAIYSFVMLPVILHLPLIWIISCAFMLHGLIFAIQDGTINVFAIEIFPVECRFSCAAFCYSIGMGIVGGTSPMVASIIMEYGYYPVALIGLYVASISLSTGILVYIINKKKRKSQAK